MRYQSTCKERRKASHLADQAAKLAAVFVIVTARKYGNSDDEVAEDGAKIREALGDN